MRPHRPCPSELSDAEWRLLEPLLPLERRLGRPPKWPRRVLADAIFYVVRSGRAWRMLPREYPPWQTVYSHSHRWWRDGRLWAAHDRLRERVRAAEGHAPGPAGAIIDSQSVRTAGCDGLCRGYDGAKRLKGRKRHLLVDATGLVLLAHVHAANLHDRTGAEAMVRAAAVGPELPRARLVWCDQACTGAFARWLETERGWRVEAAVHPDRQLWRNGLGERPKNMFRVLPRRWVVERTFAWLGQSRRLVRDYEHLPRSGGTMIFGVMMRLVLRRPAGSTA